jgi:metal-responsive CopG/Arc/MetJ family transcriptional regulator
MAEDKRVQVCITLPTRILNWIDGKRGLIKRSSYIAYLLQKIMEEEGCKEEKASEAPHRQEVEPLGGASR